ncbi:MAG: amidase family protein [Ignavibacteriota bacterium]
MKTPGDPTYWTIRQASESLRARKISSEELTRACLERIAAFNPKIDAWITVMREQALAQAKALDKESAAGRWRGPLHGIPIGLKDNIDAAGVRTTAGSKTLAGNIPSADAETTRRCARPERCSSASATCTSSRRARLRP